jgi:hypothetical protein
MVISSCELWGVGFERVDEDRAEGGGMGRNEM